MISSMIKMNHAVQCDFLAFKVPQLAKRQYIRN